MKSFFGLVVAINIFCLLGLFCTANKTFKETKEEAAKGPAEQELTALQDFPRLVIESCTLAFLMLELGKKKYLPFGERKHAVIPSGRGSGNTQTGLIGFLRLQQELITLKGDGLEIQPYTKVTVILSREEHKNDRNKTPSTGNESAEDKLARLNGILGDLKTLMETNQYEYVLVLEPLLDDNATAEDLDAELKAQFENVKAMFKPDEIALSMDIQTGSGKTGRVTADKARLNLLLTKYLADNGVPVFLHDGRSCDGNDDFDAYKFVRVDNVYGVHTGRVIKDVSVQGLIVTDMTKVTALVGYQQTQQDDKAILVAHGKVSATKLDVLESAMKLPYQKGNMQKAFEAIFVKNCGYYKQIEA